MSANDVVIVAGAGAGKTWALVDEYLRTLLGLLPGDAVVHAPERILAVTFTDKAANEMRARVLQRLAHLRFGAEQDPLADEVTVDPRVLDALRRAVSTAPILTFHALCARLLRDHASTAGVDPRFELLEPVDEERLLEETVEACVIDALQSEHAATRNSVAELLARVGLRGFGDRPALVECLVQVVSSLAERGTAAAHMTLADHEPVDVPAQLAQVRTALEPLRPHDRALAAAQACDALHAALHDDDEDPEPRRAQAFGLLRQAAGGNWGGPRLADGRKALVLRVDLLGAALVDAHLVGLSAAVRALAVQVEQRVRAEKDARGVLGFGDLLVRTRDLLAQQPALCARIGARFDRILVDEVQDTSPVQEQVLHALADAAPSGSGGMQRLLMVGDPRQSIYAFRGADPHVLARALQRAQHGGERRDLDMCRRSVPSIVALANRVATVALPRGSDGVAPDQLRPMSALRTGEGPAGAHLLVGAGSERLPPHEREALVVARELLRAFAADAYRPQDVAILVRRQKAALPLARALGRAGIRADVVGGDGFWDRPEVSDLVCALAVALDPHDELSVLSLLRSPFLCATDDEVLQLYEALPDERRFLSWPRALVAVSDVALDAGLRARMQALDALLGSVRAHVFAGRSARAVDALLDEGRYAAAMAVEPDGPLRERNVAKLRTLVDARGDDAQVGIARLAELLDERPREAVATARGDGGDDRGAVTIMTIHQAKGLEFPVVVVADAGSGIKGESDDVAYDAEVGLAVTARGRPIAACVGRASARTAPTAIQRVRRRLRDRAESELARVLYVALTRARDRVYLVGAPRRAGPGSLAGVLEVVRAADPAALDALLPRQVVDATPFSPQEAVALPVVQVGAPDGPLHGVAPAPLQRGPVRIAPSEIGEARTAQPMLFLHAGVTGVGADTEAEQERLPPRAAGRLAHALIALVASEQPDAIGDDADLLRALKRAAAACGVRDEAAELPPALLAACARTLQGPVQVLLSRGAVLWFEERLRLERSGVVVEGRADLVARLPDRTVVVELKRNLQRARGAELQASAYAAALADVEDVPVFLARWQLGDAAPAPEVALGAPLRARLEDALQEIRARAGLVSVPSGR